jgi:hypothetical protein
MDEAPPQVEDVRDRHMGLRIGVIVSLALNVLLILGVTALMLRPNVQDWFADQTKLAQVRDVNDLSFQVDDVSNAVEDTNARVDDLDGRTSDLEDWQAAACDWGQTQSTRWIGTDLFYSFLAFNTSTGC